MSVEPPELGGQVAVHPAPAAQPFPGHSTDEQPAPAAA
jgi:hypothetical protein